ncbi:chitin disaccharide deacetylase [Vibrio sp. YMD68]|uniref:chitin disaccharide deacetylase n=1 Tax=Vibrio sp. YMD68 TaxID=3042300 RepID=UPI002499E1BC|nr:chitin disaccharide deacetylase [Vibrio sp. YMD68]WGV98929.1 chitin disaccharide deacetylase [Vibrio sp. YMD68]
MKVIFNADDFGLTEGVNNGIVESHRNGVVNSTTMMVGVASEEHALTLSREYPNLKVGLHLRFTMGAPLTNHACLYGEDGHFPGLDTFWDKQDFETNAVHDEVVAQVEYFLSMGLSLSHIDSHHHAHSHPQIGPVVEKVAKLYGVPVRGFGGMGIEIDGCRYLFTDKFYGDQVDLDTLIVHLLSLKGTYDLVEVMCHPAIVDDALEQVSSYREPRHKELTILTDPRLKERLLTRGIKITDYSELDFMHHKDCV